MILKDTTLLQNGKYKITHLISQGNFSVTYEAINTTFQAKVTIKEFFIKSCCERDNQGYVKVETADLDQFNVLKEKFIEEGKFLFTHPSTIRVLDMFEENGTSYYVTSHLDNDTANLSKTIAPQKTTSEEVQKGEKSIFSPFLKDGKKRHFATNVILYLTALFSLGFILFILFFLLNGWLCGPLYLLLLLIALFFLNLKVLKWERNGFYLMPVFLLILLFPWLWFDTDISHFNDTFQFMIVSLFVIGLYFLFLLMKKNGISTWKMCKESSIWVKSVSYGSLIISILITILLPLSLALKEGFKSSLIYNGAQILNYYIHPDSSIAYDIADRLIFVEHSDDIKNIEHWYKEYMIMNGDVCFPQKAYKNIIYYFISKNKLDEAISTYKEACTLHLKSEMDKILDCGYFNFINLFFERGIEIDISDETFQKIKHILQKDIVSEHKASVPKGVSDDSPKKEEEIVVRHVHEPRQVWKERWQPCTACNGGKCRDCNGQGGYYVGNIYSVCLICSGTGACVFCNGQGGRYVPYQTWE